LQNKKREDVFMQKMCFCKSFARIKKIAKKENTSSKLSNIIQSTRNILLGINDWKTTWKPKPFLCILGLSNLLSRKERGIYWTCILRLLAIFHWSTLWNPKHPGYHILGSVSTLTKQIIIYFQKIIFFINFEIIIIFIVYYNIVIWVVKLFRV
jgi:hypothetical protein